MRNEAAHINKWRIRNGLMGTEDSLGMTGSFAIPRHGVRFHVVSSDGLEWDLPGLPWEHVSASLPNRCPTWDEMCWIKDLFWLPTETVIQFHVPARDHLKVHPFCLHLWRPTETPIPLPPDLCVAPPRALAAAKEKP